MSVNHSNYVILGYKFSEIFECVQETETWVLHDVKTGKPTERTETKIISQQWVNKFTKEPLRYESDRDCEIIEEEGELSEASIFDRDKLRLSAEIDRKTGDYLYMNKGVIGVHLFSDNFDGYGYGKAIEDITSNLSEDNIREKTEVLEKLLNCTEHIKPKLYQISEIG